jgi:GR25 family glycosyltransferase involved in LPS biosynthesis
MKYIPPHRRRQQEGGVEEQGDDVDVKVISDEILCEAFTLVYCINLLRRVDRWDTFCSCMQSNLGQGCKRFINKVQRFDAVDGSDGLLISKNDDIDFPKRDWDASNNALYDRHIQPPMNKFMAPGEVGCAMSHAKLWRLLDERQNVQDTMLILEDDAVFYNNERNGNRMNFLNAFMSVWNVLPSDWHIIYLGFSPRGKRIPVNIKTKDIQHMPVDVRLFRPTYGFHTHAYALSKTAASTLLFNGPINGPVDVWLADNNWFGLNVYCAVVANEGYNNEGAFLISQQRHKSDSDIRQSGR